MVLLSHILPVARGVLGHQGVPLHGHGRLARLPEIRHAQQVGNVLVEKLVEQLAGVVVAVLGPLAGVDAHYVSIGRILFGLLLLLGLLHLFFFLLICLRLSVSVGAIFLLGVGISGIGGNILIFQRLAKELTETFKVDI